MKKEIYATSIKDKKEFDRAGYHYTCVRADDRRHIYLYKMTDGSSRPTELYELVKAVKHKNPDGNVVYRYPTSEEWGLYGWTIWGYPETCKLKIEEKWSNLVPSTPKI